MGRRNAPLNIMYFISCIAPVFDERGLSFRESRTRCFGYLDRFPTKEDLIHFKSLRECLYDYMIIEYVPPGIHQISLSETWFVFTKEWTACMKPIWAEGVTNWALG